MIDRLICLFIGIVLGIPLGWILLVLVAILAGEKDDGPPKENGWAYCPEYGAKMDEEEDDGLSGNSKAETK